MNNECILQHCLEQARLLKNEIESSLYTPTDGLGGETKAEYEKVRMYQYEIISKICYQLYGL